MSEPVAIIRVKFVMTAMHCWPLAPPNRAYLRNPHRHNFGVTVQTTVDHDERDIEFHDLIDEAKKYWQCKESWSCETMARSLAIQLAAAYRRPFTVIVSEDGEAEAEVSIAA